MGKKNRSKRRQQLIPESRLLVILSSTEKNVSAMMDEYAKFRQSKQNLSNAALFRMVNRLAIFGEHSHLISIVEDHSKMLEDCRDDATNVFFYLKYTEACNSLNEHRKAARYSSRKCIALFEAGKDGAFKIARTHAIVCAQVGKFDEAMYCFEQSLAMQKKSGDNIHNLIGISRLDEAQLDLLLSKAHTLGNMARFLNIRSVAEYGHVKRETRHQTIETYRKAIGCLSKSENITAKSDVTIVNSAKYHCNIGFEYGKMRQWQKSHLELNIGIKILVENGALLSSTRQFTSYLVEFYSLLGRVWLNQYHESVFLGLSNIRSRKILKRAKAYTKQALLLSEDFPEDSGPIKRTFLLHDHFQQDYFLGKTKKAFSNLVPFLETYSCWTNFCHGCGQRHGEDKVMKKCATCKSAFYCNRLCQNNDWVGEGEGDPLWFQHKYLCPLLRFWRKGNIKKEPIDAKSIDIVIRKYHESFRKNKTSKHLGSNDMTCLNLNGLN